MADRTESLKQELKLLREAYATRLPEKVGQVEEAWKELEAGRGDGETLKNLHFLVHRLTGSGATYGFVGLSEEARHLERYLKTLLESSLPFNQSQIAEANALIAKVKEAVRQPELSNSANTPDLGQQISSSLNLPSEELPSRPILLIEGDQALAQDLALQIGNFGYAVHALSSLTELEKAVRKVGPAAIIAGIHFAGDTVLDGELLARIRQQNEVRIPFLFLSEEGDLTSRLQAVRVGGDAYFIKPVDVNALIDRLDLLTAYQTQEPYRVLIVEDDPALAAFY